MAQKRVIRVKRTDSDGIPRMESDLANIDNIKKWIKKQKYSKGFSFGVNPGPNPIPIVLGGSQRIMYGLNVYSETAFVGDPDLISLEVNQEKIIDNVIWWEYNPQGFIGNIFKIAEYHSLCRPLSGSDSLLLNWNALNSHKIYIVFTLADAI